MVGLSLGISEPSTTYPMNFRSQEVNLRSLKVAQVTNRTHNKTEEKEDKGDEKAAKKKCMGKKVKLFDKFQWNQVCRGC